MSLKILIINIYRKTRILIDLLINLNLDYKELSGVLTNKTKFKFKLSYSFNLPYNNGRTIRGFSFNNIHKDVHSKICRDLQKGVNTNLVIENFFNSYKIHNELSIGDFMDKLKEPKFKEFPLWSIVNPWSSISMKESRKIYLNSFYSNRPKHGLAIESFSESHIESKLYSYEDAQSQVMQHKKLFEIIKKNGYKQNYSDLPTATILIKNNSWKWMMAHSGNHRAHILYEMGHKFLRCKIAMIVNYKNLDKLKNVKNGDYSVDQAKFFFNRVFEGKNPIRGPI